MPGHPELQQQQHQGHHNLLQRVPGPPPYSTLTKSRQRRRMETTLRLKSRPSFTTSSTWTRSNTHKCFRSRIRSWVTNRLSRTVFLLSPTPTNNNTLHFYSPTMTASNRIPHYFSNSSPNCVHRATIKEIKPIRSSIIIKYTYSTFAQKVWNKYSYEKFGKDAAMTKLTDKRIKRSPQLRKPPLLSIVIRGVSPELSIDETEKELR